VASFEAHDDFVSDMSLHDRESCLLSVSGDGTLAVIDLRANKVGTVARVLDLRQAQHQPGMHLINGAA
jgi:hypothetical protein